MKRLIFALLALSFSASVAAGWVKLGETEDGAFFIDPESIRGNGHFRRVWVITNMKKQVVEGVQSYRVQWEHDCREERSRVLSLSGYTKPLAEGDMLFSSSDPQNWEPTPPNTPDALIQRVICSSGYSVRFFSTFARPSEWGRGGLSTPSTQAARSTPPTPPPLAIDTRVSLGRKLAGATPTEVAYASRRYRAAHFSIPSMSLLRASFILLDLSTEGSISIRNLS